MILDADKIIAATQAAMLDHKIDAPPQAFRSLRRIPLWTVPELTDQEWTFVSSVFYASLKDAYAMRRVEVRRPREELRDSDVRNAMLMLGAVLRVATDAQVSRKVRDAIIIVCPYCGNR